MKIPYVLGLTLLAGVYLHAGTPQDKTDAKVLAALQQYDKTLNSTMFSYKLANISQEKKCKSPLVFLNGKSGYCGTGGCNMFILDCIENGYKIIGNTSVVMPPVYVAVTSSHGYRDIKVDAGKKGLVVLKFDGEKYPENASMAPKSKKLSEDTLLLSEKDVF